MQLRLMIAGAFPLSAGPAYATQVLVSINEGRQEMTVSVDGQQEYVWPVSTGIARHATPTGTYTPFRMEEDHFSREWDDAPMPHSIFFTRLRHARGARQCARQGGAQPQDLGEREVKNIPRPVRIFAVDFDRSEPVEPEPPPSEDAATAEKEKRLDPIQVDIEITYWNTVKDSGDADMFKAYLAKYPEGEFRKLAEVSLAKLGDKKDSG